MKWTYVGGCNSSDVDCCYWSGVENNTYFETKEEAEKEAADHFPEGAFWYEVYEIQVAG